MTAPFAYPHLNLLRAFAALSVLVYHVIELSHWTDFPWAYGLGWFHLGWMAVDLFFVISGFVITHALMQWQAKGMAYRSLCQQFLTRRFWRIAPLYLLTGACFVLVNDPALWLTDRTKRLFLLKFIMFIQNWHRDSFGAINGVSWSVALEMQFYLLITLTVPLWWRCRHRPLLLWLGIWLLALATKQWTWLQAEEYHWEVFQRFTRFVRLPAVLEEFACGMVVALLMRKRSALNKPLIVALFGLLLGLACILTPIYFANGSYWNVQGMILWWRTGLGIFFGLVVAVAALCPAPATPGWLYRSLYYLGEISYGIYLWHLLIITLLMQFFALVGIPLLLTTLCLTLLLASLSWHGLEKPLIAYSKRHRP